MATNPILSDFLANQQAIKRLPVPELATSTPMAPPAAPTTLPPPPMPIVLKAPDAADNTRTRLLGDQNELKRLRDTGSGISQIQNPILRGAARAGEIGLSILAPGAAALTPGTTAHNLYLQGNAQGNVNSDLSNQQSEANTNYLAQRPEIEQSKIDQRQSAVQDRVAQAAAARGQKVSWDADGVPSFTDDFDSQEFKDHQALSAMHTATADKNKILGEIQQNHYIPGTPEWTESQRKLKQVDDRLRVAQAGLGLRSEGLELRRENTAAALTGIDPHTGQPFAGAGQIVGDDGQTTTVGSKFAPGAIKQQKNITSFNDLTGSVSHLRNAIKAYEAEGGDMSDARLAAAASDPHSVVGKVINGKLVTNGLSPAAITLLNAQRQTMEQAGILRSTTGGTSSEAGAQRILAVVPQFGQDTNASAYNKLDEQENVLSRLAPGQTRVAGGMSVRHPGKSAPSTSGGDTIPAAAAAQLQEGVQHTFKNGQVWTKTNGNPVRVK